MIEDYGFGRITIDGKTYYSNLLRLRFPWHVEDHWWRKESHQVKLEDLRALMEARPDTLVVGTGYFWKMGLDPMLIDWREQEGIQLIVCETKKACAEFNRLRATQKVVAALHLTC